jgi:hypothetical protein
MQDVAKNLVWLGTTQLLTAEVQRLRQESVGFDEILRRLRDRGCSKGQSMAVLAGLSELGSSPLVRAKALVHDSPVWADAKDRDERLFDDPQNSN